MALVPFSIVDGLGRVLMHGEGLEVPVPLDGCHVVEGLPPSDRHWRDVGADVWVDMGEAPSPACVFDWPSHSWVDPRSLDDIRAEQLAVINAEARRQASALTAGYPDFERQTWPTQEREALAWQVNASTPTPYLDGIATARGIAPEDMRAKTLEAVLAFRGASQYLVGTRQALRDAIYAATTPAAVLAVVWPPESPTT